MVLYDVIFGIIIELISLAIYLLIRGSENRNTEYTESTSVTSISSVVVIPNSNENEENTPDDDLPPYTPPTPKTQAAMADLPPSYNESYDITETYIPINNTNSIVSNNDSNVNMPPLYVDNTDTINNTNLSEVYTVPEIIVDPLNTRTTSLE